PKHLRRAAHTAPTSGAPPRTPSTGVARRPHRSICAALLIRAVRLVGFRLAGLLVAAARVRDRLHRGQQPGTRRREHDRAEDLVPGRADLARETSVALHTLAVAVHH